jgi:hypothetical protein
VTIRPSFINIKKISGGKKWASNGFIRMGIQDLISAHFPRRVVRKNKK